MIAVEDRYQVAALLHAQPRVALVVIQARVMRLGVERAQDQTARHTHYRVVEIHMHKPAELVKYARMVFV